MYLLVTPSSLHLAFKTYLFSVDLHIEGKSINSQTWFAAIKSKQSLYKPSICLELLKLMFHLMRSYFQEVKTYFHHHFTKHMWRILLLSIWMTTGESLYVRYDSMNIIRTFIYWINPTRLRIPFCPSIIEGMEDIHQIIWFYFPCHLC